MNILSDILIPLFNLYFILDCYILLSLWITKEHLVQYHMLWIPIPFTGILFFKHNYKEISSLPGFTKTEFIFTLILIPSIFIITYLALFLSGQI